MHYLGSVFEKFGLQNSGPNPDQFGQKSLDPDQNPDLVGGTVNVMEKIDDLYFGFNIQDLNSYIR